MKARTYLDAAAALPVSGAARRAYTCALQVSGNPSAAHAEGRAAREVVEEARRVVAALAAARPESVVFTSGATEANAIAIEGHVRALVDAGRKIENIHILYSPGAHASLVNAVEKLGREGALIEDVSLRGGAVDLTALKGQLRPETALVCLEVICGETGTRFDTRAVRRILDEARKTGEARIILHADASQVPLVESFDHTRIGADLLVLDAGKVGGVRGAGALIRNLSVPLMPLILGGGQEGGLRSGTEAHAAIASFAAALQECAKNRKAFTERALRARDALEREILAAIPDAQVNAGPVRAPHIVNFSFPGRDTDFLVALLDEAGFAVSTRSACETDSVASRAVLAETGDTARAGATLRVSLPSDVRESTLRRFAAALVRAVVFLDQARL